MLELIIAAHAAVGVFSVVAGLAIVVMFLWAIDHRQRTRYSADGRGQRHGKKTEF